VNPVWLEEETGMNKVISLGSAANGVPYFMHGLLFMPVIPAVHLSSFF
jgi:hypothetical protein